MKILRNLLQRFDSRLSRHGELGAALVKGVVGFAGIKVGHAAIGLVTAVLLARLLGPASFGTYAFVMALVAFLTIPSELGIPGLAVREIAVTNARKDWPHMRGFIIKAHQVTGVLSAVLIIAGAVALHIAASHVEPVKLRCMMLGLALVPLVSLGALRGGMLRGLRKVLLGQLPEQIVRPLSLAVLVVLLWAAGRPVDSPVTVMYAQIAATAIAFAVGLYFFVRHRPAELLEAVPQYRTREWLKSSIPFGLSAALLLINGRTDVLILGIFRADAEVGIYRVASQIALLVIFGLQAVNAIQGPHIARLYATGDMKRLQKMVTRSSQAILLIAAPMVLVIVLLGRFIISTFFGVEYVGAYVPLVILCAGQLVNASMGSVASLLNMTGHERDTMRIIFIGAAVNVSLNFLLTPRWGMTGAAISTSATLIVWNLLMWRKVRARTGIEASPFLRSGRR
jgi:O-antigen/teichoic acid export membrane protein